MMEKKIVILKTLTPICTGNEERKCKELRETGIIGSLRWWFEALIRGIGRYACDPTSHNRCSKTRCAACELFGNTGWARKFRLEIETEGKQSVPEVYIGTRQKRKDRQRREKYLKRKLEGIIAEEIMLKIIPLKEISPEEWFLLNKTFEIIADYGALGARTSQGNGVVKIIKKQLPPGENPLKNSAPEIKDDKQSLSEKLPDLSNFFFYKFLIEFTASISNLIDQKIFWTHAQNHRNFNDNWENWKILWENYSFLPIAFHIRDALRPLEAEKGERHEIFGIGGKGSKIFVSHGYKVNDTALEVRIWGYDVKDEIKNKIKNKFCYSLKAKLFSGPAHNRFLKGCKLKEEKAGKEIIREL